MLSRLFSGKEKMRFIDLKQAACYHIGTSEGNNIRHPTTRNNMDQEKIVLEIGDLLAKLRTETKINVKVAKQLDKVDEEINILYKLVEFKNTAAKK